MKDKKDRVTVDIFTNAKPVGRPRKYISNAAKQKAYRQRLKQSENSIQEDKSCK